MKTILFCIHDYIVNMYSNTDITTCLPFIYVYMFTYNISTHVYVCTLIKNNSALMTLFFVKKGHGIFFRLVSDFDVWLHGGVVAMACPFHNDLRRDPEHQGVTNESLTPHM